LGSLVDWKYYMLWQSPYLEIRGLLPRHLSGGRSGDQV
jgi:hypothetical protein